MSLGKTCFNKSLLGTSSQIQIITPTPLVFRSNLNGSAKLFTKNCEVGKELSSLVSLITTTSICCAGSELLFRFTMITLFIFLNLRFLISDKWSRDVSLIDLTDLSLNLF